MANSDVLTGLFINVATGIEEIKELTKEEINQLNKIAEENAARQVATEAKAAARQSALAKLAELGLTEEEIAAL